VIPGNHELGYLLWFANRGTGVVLMVLLTLATMLGVLSTSRATNPRWPRMLSQGLHRNVSLLAVVFLTGHTVTAVVDSYIGIHWWQAFVPFTSTYRPPWLSFGVLSLDLLIAISLTSMLRQRMRHRPWRVVHVMAYASWALGLLHGMQGTDSTGTVWGAAVNYACIAAVSMAVLARFGLIARSKLVTT